MTDLYTDRCVLCLDEKLSPVQIKCGHSFCYECLNTHRSYQNYAWANKCPICRHNLKEPDVSEVKVKHNITSSNATLEHPSTMNAVTATNTSIESDDYYNADFLNSIDQILQESTFDDYFYNDYEEDTSYYNDEDEQSYDQQDSISLENIEDYYFHEDAQTYEQQDSPNLNLDDMYLVELDISDM